MIIWSIRRINIWGLDESSPWRFDRDDISMRNWIDDRATLGLGRIKRLLTED
jgi:hypothetical protein